jgi:hypothetical protein
MMRKDPASYWRPDNQRACREALAAAHGVTREEPGALRSPEADAVRAAMAGGAAASALAPVQPAKPTA